MPFNASQWLIKNALQFMQVDMPISIGSEVWVLKKREEQRLEATQMKFLDTFLE